MCIENASSELPEMNRIREEKSYQNEKRNGLGVFFRLENPSGTESRCEKETVNVIYMQSENRAPEMDPPQRNRIWKRGEA